MATTKTKTEDTPAVATIRRRLATVERDRANELKEYEDTRQHWEEARPMYDQEIDSLQDAIRALGGEV